MAAHLGQRADAGAGLEIRRKALGSDPLVKGIPSTLVDLTPHGGVGAILIGQVALARHHQVVLELGRSVVASCGTYLTSVVDTKTNVGSNYAIVDGGSCAVGVESTIIDLTVTPPRLLRPGGLPLESLRAVLGEVTVDRAVTGQVAPGEKPRAPEVEGLSCA